MPPKFVPFGTDHLAALALTMAVPLALAIAARRKPAWDAWFRYGFAGLLIATWIAWYALFIARGWLGLGNALPMNLCDWATIALIVTLIQPRQAAYELAYFWAFAGTVQGLITPDVNFGFPEPQFLVFILGHAAILSAVIYLTFGTRMRQVRASIPRVIGWSLSYAVAAALTDWTLGTNYGFFRAKPGHATFYDLLSPWPFYIPETVALGMGMALLLYLPWFIRDNFNLARIRRR
ncbi:MAG: TIGR02206 family membrane protein [Alphaproteobacteria bacterium]|nr:TIGR02206 family membrane protein [Alphaproteobacteria bacterium]MBV9694468.1 TIGR02206 family membrane protein [Alphaproteobacteria bacterium]